MTRYYHLFGRDEDNQYGIAYVPKGTPLFLLPLSGVIEKWELIVFTLKQKGYCDYLANNLGCRLCSRKLKNILDNSRSELDELQWLSVIVRDEQGHEEEYFILHFPIGHDVLDKRSSIFGPQGNVIKPVISRTQSKKHHVFVYSGAGEHRLLVSEQAKNAVVSEGCTGVAFEEAASRE